MGVILDSSTVIARERTDKTVAELLTGIRSALGPEQIALTTISVVELEHGIWRAKNSFQEDRRRQFLNELFAAVPVYSLTFTIARRAARVSAEAKKSGCVIPFRDLIIGVTALELGFSVATLNIAHFELIPGLQVYRL